MTALEEYIKRSRKASNDYFEIKDMFLELQGYRKAYNRLLEEKRKLSEKVNKESDYSYEKRYYLIDKDKVALEVISNVIEDIELNIELSKVVE